MCAILRSCRAHVQVLLPSCYHFEPKTPCNHSHGIYIDKKCMISNRLQTYPTVSQSTKQKNKNSQSISTNLRSLPFPQTRSHSPTGKKAQDTTSGVIYLLMFFPLRHNRNGRIKEVVNNSNRGPWTH